MAPRTRVPDNAMPSKRKQLNIRMSAETEADVAKLIPVISKAVGLDVSQSDIFRLGVIELKKKFLGEGVAAAVGIAEQAKAATKAKPPARKRK